MQLWLAGYAMCSIIGSTSQLGQCPDLKERLRCEKEVENERNRGGDDRRHSSNAKMMRKATSADIEGEALMGTARVRELQRFGEPFYKWCAIVTPRV